MTRHTHETARPFGFKPTLASLAVAACFAHSAVVLANPTGAQVAAGSAQFNTTGSTLTVTNTPGTIINWQQFNINAGETTRFQQQSANSAILNRVVGNDLSKIYGTLQSNGQVYLINPNGIIFGANAIIDVNKLVASTLNLSDANFLNRVFSFSGGGTGPLLNQGRISTPLGGSVFLIGSDVRNEGIITSPQGQVVLAAGNSVSLSDTAGPELSVTISANGNKAVNLGTINAAGGSINMFGALIEQQGVLSADSASVDAQGRIILKATDSTTVSGTLSATNSAGKGGDIQVLGDQVTLTASARLDASGTTGGGTVLVGGDWQGSNSAIQNATNTTMQAGAEIKADATQNGNGGKVVLWSNGATDFKGSIFARGGAEGGNGGQVETSGHQLGIGGTVNTLAPKGQAGNWLIDPAKICFLPDGSTSCSWSADSFAYQATVYTPSSLNSMLSSSNVTVQATDYFAFMPNGGTYTVAAGIPAGRLLSVQAPYIFANGTLDARTNNVDLRVRLEAYGTSSLVYSPTIKFGSGANVSLPGSGTIPDYYNDYTNGTFVANSGGGIIFANGARIDVGNPSAYAGGVLLRGQSIDNLGASIRAAVVALETDYPLVWPDSPSLKALSIEAWRAEIRPFTTGTSVVLGNMNDSRCTNYAALCFTDVASFFTGTWNKTEVGAYGYNSSSSSYATLEVLGPFNARARDLELWSTGSVFIRNSPLTVAGELDIGSDYGGVHVYAPLEASYISLWANYSGNVKIHSSVTGTGVLAPLNPPGSADNYVPTAKDPTVFIGLGDADNFGTNTASGSTIGDFILSTNSSAVGTPSINASNGKAWAVTVPTSISTIPSGLAGYGYTAYASFAAAKSAGYFQKTDLTNDAWAQNHKPFIIPAAVSTTTTDEAALAVVSDPCKLNPSSCGTATDPSKTLTTTTTSSVVNTTLSAPLSISASLTTDQRYVASADKADTSASTTTSTASKIEAKLTTKSDSEKTTQEVRAEAQKAKSEARKAEEEAKKAEAEAKQAEAEAKSAKTPQQRAEAQRRAQAKRAEAEAKKAEAEAKQAEAEGREALAEAKQVAGDAKEAAPVVVARRVEAESRQSRAEAKRADAEAKKTEIEAKQAEAEVRAAKTPEQKLVATQKAEAKKAEVQALKEESKARQAEAEAKGTEAKALKAEGEARKAAEDAKTAKTPEQRAQAEKRAETQKDKAEVLKAESEAQKTKAEAQQAKAEAKQAAAESKSQSSPGAREVSQKKVEAKQAEAEHKEARANAQKAEASEKQARSEEKQARNEEKQAREQAKAEKNPQKKAEAEKKAVEKKVEADRKGKEAEKHKAEAEKQKTEAEKKKVDADKKAEAHRKAEEKRSEERKVEAAKAFAKVVTAGASRGALENLVRVRHELKTEALKPALSVLDHNPAAADLPPCGGADVVCMPQDTPKLAPLPSPLQPTVAFLPQVERKVALMLGVNKYTDPAIPSLESALPDAEAVGKQLSQEMGYDVRVVPDATRADIVTSLNQLAREVGPNDSVTIYYAGHGYLNEKTNTGYWIPGDAKASSPANWISNNDVARLLNQIPAKQVMLVSDSCYSGSLTKEALAGTHKLDPNIVLAKRSVMVLSSGGEEPVSDEGKDGHSIFAYTFMKNLREVKDVASASSIFDATKKEVSAEFPQTPHFGGVISAGHATGGDYLFEKRSYK